MDEFIQRRPKRAPFVFSRSAGRRPATMLFQNRRGVLSPNAKDIDTALTIPILMSWDDASLLMMTHGASDD